MQVQRVELHRRHLIDNRVDRLDRLIVASNVEHQPAPAETGRIFNGHCRHLDRLAEATIGAQQLGDGHRAIEQSAVARGADADAPRVDRKPIGFVAADRSVARKRDRTGAFPRSQ